MMPNKILITIVGMAMIGLLLYPPTNDVIRTSTGVHVLSSQHSLIWEFSDYQRPDFLRLALYELAIAGVGALIHFVTRK